jgi:hypothetical protein
MQTTRFETPAHTMMSFVGDPLQYKQYKIDIAELKTMGVKNIYLGNVTFWDSKAGVFDPMASMKDKKIGISIDDMMKNVDYLHSQGLEVTIRPQVNEYIPNDNSAVQWKNFLNPSQNVGDTKAFFEQYTKYMVDLARASQAHGVKDFSIGNEMLNFITPQTAKYWENLIDQVRGVFSGKLTYAAFLGFSPNYKNDISQSTWLNKLDYIGVDFYPQLTLNKNATYEDFVRALYGDNPQKVNWVDYLKSLVEKTGKKIMFTEFGIAGYDGAAIADNIQGNIENPNVPIDHTEQANWFKAVLSVISSELGENFKGTATWSGVRQFGNGWEKTFNVINHPAEDVIRTAYTDGELDGLTKTIAGTYSGSFNNDTITGSSGADSVSGGRGSDTINLGVGNDTVVINSTYNANVRLKIDGSTLIVKSEDGTDRLSNVETIQFNNLKLDVSVFNGSADPLNIYRFYNTQTGTHFYSNSPTERNTVLNNLDQFLYEGVGFKALAGGDDPVYRFFNSNTGTHFYTISSTERDAVKGLAGFQFEGIAYMASDTKIGGSHELFRFYNTKTGTHFYTDNVGERDAVKLIGNFQYEGVAYYVG